MFSRISIIIFMVVFSTGAMASWSKTLSQSAFDDGEMDMNGRNYIRFPSKNVAASKVDEMLRDSVKEQLMICTDHGGQFHKFEVNYTFKYESTWPYYWFCSGEQIVSCDLE